MNLTTISPGALHRAVLEGRRVDLIDVRTPAEFREVHVAFARNVPLDRLDAADGVRNRRETDGPLYVICRSGSRGRQACARLTQSGVSNVLNVEGGTAAWEEAGLPVVRGRRTISLERQVRIAAGSLVLLGAALGALAHPLFFGLSALVGAGLVFAGVTDTCGMARVLARMPWNSGRGSEPSCCAARPGGLQDPPEARS
ncbi:MAG: Inner membrane protein YgaP [Phycisphaerae bacterium]|nr:Inner membrane protein YgaP [Phycisphaerae bacterium]